MALALALALALAAGFVLDDAIVVSENVSRHMRMDRDRSTAAHLALLYHTHPHAPACLVD